MMDAAVQVPSRVRALMRSIPSVRDLGLRRGVMRRHLETWTPAQLAIVVQRLAPLAAARDERARQTAFALGLALADHRVARGRDVVEPARALAAEQGLELAAAILATPEGHRALSWRARLPRTATAARLGPRGAHAGYYLETEPEGPVPWADHYDADTIAAMDAETLEAWAVPPAKRVRITTSRPERRRAFALAMDAFALHGDPEFVRRLLQAEAITERDVLRIATRRPTTSAIAHAILASDRWIVSDPVQHAVLTNPCTPPWLVLPLLPSASVRTSKSLVSAQTADPFVVEVAGRIAASAR